MFDTWSKAFCEAGHQRQTTAYPTPIPPTPAIAAYIRDELAPLAVGEDALAPEALWRRVQDVNLTVRAGEIHAVVGENGGCSGQEFYLEGVPALSVFPVISFGLGFAGGVRFYF